MERRQLLPSQWRALPRAERVELLAYELRRRELEREAHARALKRAESEKDER